MTDRRKSVDSKEWEARCRRCARCCYEKVEFEGRIYYTDTPCEKLDLATRRCTVYAERTRRRPGCVQLTPDLVRRGFLPADCPYVADIDDYRPPVLFHEEEE